ncbi:MAG: MarR family winged helix-turn-helix transcriptional regulator [Gaiellaceae bacterium]
MLQLLGALNRGTRPRSDSLPEPLRAAFAEGSLGPRHMPPLFALTMGGPASVGDLATRINLAPTTTSLLVNELSRAGLVERKEDESDRRRTIVDVSDEIRGPLAEHASKRISMVQRALDRLDHESRAHFIQGLRALVEEWE